MNILFIGDIVGKQGRDVVRQELPKLKQERNIHLVIANAENIAHGMGATGETIQELLDAGVHFFTSGNHIWHTKEIISKLNDKQYPLLRPANYPQGNPGRGYGIVETALLKKVLVINLQGRIFMPEGLDSPFYTADRILSEYAQDRNISAIIVDVHAEATSEKHALRHYLDGRVTALLGTHTHVQTNDAYITPRGMAYITDVGMSGVYYPSVIGVHPQSSLDLFLLAKSNKWELAEGDAIFQAVFIEVDESTKQAVLIETIQRGNKKC